LGSFDLSFFEELKRRNVFRVAIAYAVISWLLLQVGDTLAPALHLPDWINTALAFFLVLGFPLAIFFAWAFELTPEGVKREREVDRSQSIIHDTGRKLDFTIIILLALALGYFAYDKFILSAERDAELVEATTQAVAELAATEPEESTEPDKSVAVLPFAALSSGKDDGYFADGLTEEILNALSQLPELQVTARTSSFFFKDKNIPVPEIAGTLGVKHIVEGSVRRAGERLRVTAQLIRAEDGFHLWSETYDRTMDDVFAVQEEIAESVARALEVVLDDDKRRRMREAGLRDVEAFIAWQKGLEFNARAYDEGNLTGPSAQQAHAYFKKVLDRAPDFAPAFFLHSDYFGRLLFGHRGTEELLSAAELAAAHAALNADLDAAYAAATGPGWRALIDAKRIFFSDDWRGLTDRLNRAFAAESCMPPNWVFEVSPALGLYAGVLPVALRTITCDPLNVRAPGTLVFALMWSGDSEGTLEALKETEKRIEEGGVLAKFMWTPALIVAGRADEALGKMAGLPLIWTAYNRAMLAAADGRLDESRMMLDELGSPNQDFLIAREAWTGGREAANRVASEIDSAPGGPAHLVNVVLVCYCGAPFDLEATPNFAARLQEANIPWPPPSPVNFPAKDW
jgi:adenylate cyclase